MYADANTPRLQGMDTSGFRSWQFWSMELYSWKTVGYCIFSARASCWLTCLLIAAIIIWTHLHFRTPQISACSKANSALNEKVHVWDLLPDSTSVLLTLSLHTQNIPSYLNFPCVRAALYPRNPYMCNRYSIHLSRERCIFIIILHSFCNARNDAQTSTNVLQM